MSMPAYVFMEMARDRGIQAHIYLPLKRTRTPWRSDWQDQDRGRTR